MHSSVRRFGLALLALLLSMAALRVAGAQDGSPQAGGQSGLVSEETLSATTFDLQSTGASKATFQRLTMTGQGTARLAVSAKPSFFFLEQGSWNVRLDSNTGSLTPTSSVLVNGTPLAPNSTVSLDPGGWLLLPPSASVEVSSQNSAPTASLAVLFSDQSTPPAGQGVSWQPIGNPVDVPSGANSIAFTRLTLDPGAAMTPEVTSGPTLFDTRAGSVILLLNPGEIQISRAGGGNETVTAGYIDPSTVFAEEDDVAPTAVGAIAEPPGTPLAGTAVGLAAGDGAVLQPGATQALRVTDNATAVVMVLTISHS